MKKTYMHPEMKVVKIQNKSALLLTSGQGVKTNDYLGDEYEAEDVSY